jgi:NAD(P)H-dependent FMN reductase
MEGIVATSSAAIHSLRCKLALRNLLGEQGLTRVKLL